MALSIEETNKLRVSLGLKPLNLEAPKQRVEQRKPPAEEPKPDADAIRAKLTEAREKRRREQELHQTRGLGEADGDDDVASWVHTMRKTQQPGTRQREEGGEGTKRRRSEGRAHEGEEEQDAGGAAEVAGARVRHGADELAEGETLVLTLADAPILDETGALNEAGDELEEVARAQDKARARARRAAGKEAKPLWAEDGRVRSLLDKYDEEEAEASFVLDDAGRAAAQAARQDEVRKRLAAAASALNAVAAPTMGGAADYMTAEEMATAGGGLKKKKKKRKLRTTRVAAEEEEEEGGGGLDLDALEAAAQAEGGGGDLGTREARQERRAAREAAAAADAAERSARFARALEKANWASEALRAPAAPAEVEDEAEAELAESLSRARRLVQLNSGSNGAAGGDASNGAAVPESMGEIAQRLAKKREEDEQQLREQLASGGSDFFNAATEFVRNIGAAQGEDEEEVRQQQPTDASYMDVDMEDAAGQHTGEQQPGPGYGEAAAGDSSAPKPPSGKQRNYRKRGGWVSAEDEGGQGGEDQQAEHQQGSTAKAEPSASVAGDRAIGRGLAGALNLLHDTGALKGQTEWAGRTNEKKAVALIGLDDVYTGGTQEDRMARSIEAALTQRDEFGRVMTPKERFRTLCHQFHGIFPSKNQETKRFKKYLEDQAIKKATTSEDPSGELDKLRSLQQQLGTPYLPLDSKTALPGKAGDDDDAPLPLARGKGGGSGKPQLAGGLTPLLGDKKVEAMYGIKKPPTDKGSMPPPKSKGK